VTSQDVTISRPIGRESSAMSVLHIACAVLVPLLWGAQYAVIKVGLAVFPPLFFAGLRFAVIALLLIPLVGGLKKRDIGPVLLISIFMGGVNFGGAFIGLTHSPAGIAGIANQLWTPFTLLLAWPILGERPSLRAILGVALAFGGLVLSVADPTTAAAPIVPTLFVIGSAVGLASGNVLTKRLGPFDPLKLFAWMSLFTAAQLLLLSLFLESGQVDAIVRATSSQWIAFGFTVFFGGITAFGIWFWLIARFSIARVAPYALLQSFFSIAAGVVFQDEPLTAALVAGAVICVAGVTLSQLSLPQSFIRKVRAK
jgi:O-acetylserine/cysteine efflux transporter